MSIIPIITFKAGICDVDTASRPYKVQPQAKKGYIYLYAEEDLIHFCWRARDEPLDEPSLDLVMIPADGHFVPFDTHNEPSSKTNGRIFVLKFSSSSQRHVFWLQSKPQGRTGNPSWFSPRDLKLGEIVDKLLQGEEVDVNRELASVRGSNNNDDEDPHQDDDETMEDVEGTGDPHEHHEGGDGGAGPDATGGDFRKEGEDAREGGADGARAASNDAAAVVRNFLDSLKGAQGLSGGQSSQGKIYPVLNDLLDTPTTIPMLEAASDSYVDNLLNFLPPAVLVLAQQGDSGDAADRDPSEASVAAARAALSSDEKRALLKKVLRSPQFHQSLASLSMGLRNGGLASISEALGIAVQNGGLVRGGTVALGGGDAIEAFIDGVKRTVQKEAGRST